MRRVRDEPLSVYVYVVVSLSWRFTIDDDPARCPNVSQSLTV